MSFYKHGSFWATFCGIFGHKSSGTSTPIYCNAGIAYHADVCPRCFKRNPVSTEDAAKKARNDAYVSSVMNGSRAQYGLKPISWET